MNKAYLLAREDIGTKEIHGAEDNPVIVQYFKDVGHAWVQDDETAWCAAFVGAMLERAGLPSTKRLNARSYMDWGVPVDLKDAQPGDIVVFWRGKKDSWEGHVAFFVKETNQKIRVLGGNQLNMVNETDYSKDRLLGIRRIVGGREKLTQSKTMGAVGAGVASLAGMVGSLWYSDALKLIPIVAIITIFVAFMIVGKERIKKWKDGIR